VLSMYRLRRLLLTDPLAKPAHPRPVLGEVDLPAADDIRIRDPGAGAEFFDRCVQVDGCASRLAISQLAWQVTGMHRKPGRTILVDPLGKRSASRPTPETYEAKLLDFDGAPTSGDGDGQALKRRLILHIAPLRSGGVA
jgi:hypothetical protein